MEFENTLLEGTLLNRDSRFVANVSLKDGTQVEAHCPNAGSLLGCSEPGSRVLVSPYQNPRSRHKHQLEIIYAGKVPVGIHAARPISIVSESVMNGQLHELAGYAKLQRDPNRYRQARIDLIASGNSLRTCYLRIETVTLAQENVAYYPDTKLEKYQNTIQILTNLVREGNRVMLIFIAQREDVELFKMADHIDPDTCQVMRDGFARGIEAICYRTKVTKKGIELDKAIPVEL